MLFRSPRNGIGAHKAGKAWKSVAQPDKPDRQSTEEEVLEQAEEERGAMSETADAVDEDLTDDADSSPPTEVGTTTEDETAPTPEVSEPPVVEEAVEEEAASAEPEYTDDELRAFGWSDEQIEWQRQSEAMQKE